MPSTRRIAAAGAVALAVLGSVSLAACSSSSDNKTPSKPSSSSAAPAPEPGASMIGPISVKEGQDKVEAEVGRQVVFNVAEPGNWDISSSDTNVFSVTPGGTDGSATFNPGGTAVAPGTAAVTLENKTSKEAWVVTVTVTGGPIGGDTLPPVMVEPNQDKATAKVGDTLYFNVPNPADWTIMTTDAAIVEVTQGGKDGGSVSAPTGKALKAGEVTITLENDKGGEAQVVTVTVK